MIFDFVILDEAHSIKNKDSLRARNMLPIAIRAKRLILMTGIPLLSKPYEGYPLLHALRPDYLVISKNLHIYILRSPAHPLRNQLVGDFKYKRTSLDFININGS